MSQVVIAAIDDSEAAQPVLTVARRVADLFGDSLLALHVSSDDVPTAVRHSAATVGAPVRVCHGDATSEITAAAGAADVRGIVVGRRRPDGRGRGIGDTALALIQTLAKPVVVVPPNANVRRRRLQRLLVPLDGTGETAAAVERLLATIAGRLEVVALHVLEPDAIPAFSDQLAHEPDAWRAEFRRRWLPADDATVTLETRVGRASDVIRACSREFDVDLVALGWKQELAHGRAQVVASLLTDAETPVLLLPLARADVHAPTTAATSRP